MPSARPVHANFREAYCHHHGCSADGFERHLLMRIIPWHFRPLAAVSFWMSRELFASELEVIRNAAPARTGREVNAAAQDLVHLRFVEKSFRRSIGMRGRSEAVVEAWNEVKETVDRPAQPDQPPVGLAESTGTVKAASRAEALGRRGSALTFRFLEQVQREIARGKSLQPLLDEAALTRDQLLQLLDSDPRESARFHDLRDRLTRLPDPATEKTAPRSPTQRPLS